MTSFSFGGTTLASIGIVTVIDDYLSTPLRRGSDQQIPFSDGQNFVTKYYDERILSFGITIVQSSAANLESTMETFRKLISPHTQQTLAMTMQSGAVRNIQAIVEKALQVKRITPGIAQIVVEFVCSSPYWLNSTVIADNTTTINANPTAMTVTNPGTVDCRIPTLILTGPLSNTVITNSTNGLVLTYTGTIASPRVVTIQVNTTGEWKCTDDLSNNLIGNLSHSGDVTLMSFIPGANTLSIADSTHSTGTVKASFYAPYL